jgi:manganese/zinc/iron transport system permease protein
VIVALSLLFAPNRGLIWNWLRQGTTRRQLRAEAVLADLAELEAQHAGHAHGHSAAVLQTMNPGHGIRRTLRDLAARGLVQRVDDDAWILTDTGRVEASQAGRRLTPLASGSRPGSDDDHHAA